MDIDVMLKRHIRTELKCSVKDYCYHDNNVIEINIAKEDYDKICSVKKLIIEDMVFKKKMKVEENKNDLGIFFSYELRPDIDISVDITRDNRKKYGVIAPDGRFYECGYAGHHALEYYLSKRSVIADSPEYGEHAFEYYGWMKLTGAAMTECEFTFDYEITKWDRETKIDTTLKENLPTKEQFETVKKYIESLGREHFNFNHQWYHLNDIEELLKRGKDRHFGYECDDKYKSLIDENELYKDGQER